MRSGLTILPVLIMVGSLVLDRPALVFFTASIILAVVGMLAIRYFVLLAERYSTNESRPYPDFVPVHVRSQKSAIADHAN